MSSSLSPTDKTLSIAFISSLPLRPFISSSSLYPSTCNITSNITLRRSYFRRRHVSPARLPYLTPICVAHHSSTSHSSTCPDDNNEKNNSINNNTNTNINYDNTPQINYPLGAPSQPARIAPRYWTRGLRDDLSRRLPLYLSDWRNGFKFKSIPVILFLYFASLAPVVAFGGLTSTLTGGSIGVIEFLLSSGAAGMLYAIFSGQPLTFIAPTGLTLAFTTALYTFCNVYTLPFLPTYAWVGIWTSIMLFFAAITNVSDIIKYCTRFTDDIFNSLIATNFIYEASRSLATPFLIPATPDKTSPFVALVLALGTFLTARFLAAIRSSRYLFHRARVLLSDFGPVLSIASMSFLAASPIFSSLSLPRLSIPTDFSLAHGRTLLVPIFTAPLSVRLIAMIPAILLTCLFFLDQNISVRVVNSPAHNLRKGPAYHLDMLILSISTFLTSLCGLPWMCAGTVQSLAHVRALADIQINNDDGIERFKSVQENRLTPFCVHAAIFSSIFLLPILQRIPMAVISGLFLYLGDRMMRGNDFLSRIRYLAMDPELYPQNSPMRTTSPLQVHAFTLLQLTCLAMLWALKLNKKTSMFFPAVIATLMFIRSKIAPRIFPEKTLKALDGELVESEEDVHEQVVLDPKLSAAN